MGYFGSEGIYDSNLSFWAKNSKKNFGPNATSGECTIVLSFIVHFKFWDNSITIPTQ